MHREAATYLADFGPVAMRHHAAFTGLCVACSERKYQVHCIARLTTEAHPGQSTLLTLFVKVEDCFSWTKQSNVCDMLLTLGVVLVCFSMWTNNNNANQDVLSYMIVGDN